MGAGDDFFAFVFGSPGRDIEFYWNANNRVELDTKLNEGERLDSSHLPDLEVPVSEDPHDWTPEQIRRMQSVWDYTIVIRKKRKSEEETQRRAQRYRDLMDAKALAGEVEEFLWIEGAYHDQD